MTNSKYNNKKITQIDKVLSSAAKFMPKIPDKGWIHEIRKSLMISNTLFAKRLQIDPSVISRLESSERKQTITLSNLQRAAEALGCEVKYVIVPKVPLEKQLWNQAKKIVRKEEKEISHAMKLEQQETLRERELDDDIKAAFLLSERGGKIWDE